MTTARGRWTRTTIGLAAAAIAAACGGDGPTPPAGATAESAAVEAPAPAMERDPVRAPDVTGLDPDPRMAVMNALSRYRAADDPSIPTARQAEVLGDLAVTYHGVGLLDPAIEAYRRTAALAPEDGRWLYYRGRAELEARRAADALETLNRAVRSVPGYAPAWVALGEARLAAGDADAAFRAFVEAWKRDPEAAAAVDGQGRAAMAAGKIDDAIERFERALALDPEASAVRGRLANALSAAGRDADAARERAAAGDREPRLRDPWMARVAAVRAGGDEAERQGMTLARQRRWDEAARAFAQAAAASPDDPELQYYLGTCAILAGRPGEGEAALARALEIDPRHARTHVILARLRADDGEDGRALGHYRSAMDARPADVDLRVEAGAAMLRAGEPAEALRLLDPVVLRAPRRVDARMGRAFALIALGRWADARNRLEDDRAAHPADPRIASILARVLAAAPDDSVRDGGRARVLAESLAQQMKSADSLETLAMAYAETGAFGTATEIQERVLEIARDLGDAGRIRWLEAVLAEYRAGRACRTPWWTDDPGLRPAPVPAVPDFVAASG